MSKTNETHLKTIFLACDRPEESGQLSQMILRLGYRMSGATASLSAVVQQVKDLKPHVLLLSLRCAPADILELNRNVVMLGLTAVVVLVENTQVDLAHEAMGGGACGYLIKPFDPHQLGAIAEISWHWFQTTKTLQDQAKALNESLELRKLLEKAKGILMQQQKLSEEQAHRALQKMSQDQSIPLKELCQLIVQFKPTQKIDTGRI